ncbi:hypothetical protein DOTSEDRAFT_70560 [Dothistroma septosporum NZE10]|uniref:Uncharacterized protein n=1 Tax=Dothistroma septosporum (strain NZE10 / CBS 128990) TaxID=675120 RepID=N1PUG5_DOTSN|nr:hypothetical protein DOTSEDRAFT_70560 [Dothistroma septosporum NZE10]
MSGQGQGGGITEALKAGVNYLTGSSNTAATGNSSTHQEGVDHIQNKLNEKDPNTISTPGLSSQDASGSSRDNFSSTGGNTTPQTLPTSELEQRGLPGQVANSYRDAANVAPGTTGSAEAIHDKREMQQELQSIVAQPAPATSEGVGHGTGASIGGGNTGSSRTGTSQSGAVAPQSATGSHGVQGSGYPAVGIEQTITGIDNGAYSDNGVRGGGVGTTNQTGSVAPLGSASTTHSGVGQGTDFVGHRSADDIAAVVAGLPAESTRGIQAPKAGWHPSGGAEADGTERSAKDLSAPDFTSAGANAAGLTDRTRNDPAFDQSGHSRSSDLTAGPTGLGAGTAATGLSKSTRNDPAHDTSGTFEPESATKTHDIRGESNPQVGSAQQAGNDNETHTSEHHTSVLGAGAGGAGLAAGVAGGEVTHDHDNTTRKERTDPTDTATDKLRRDPTHSATDDAVLGSDAVGQQASRGERGTSGGAVDTTTKERTDPTDSATEKLRRDPAHSASDDHVLGSDAQGQQSSRGENVDPELRQGHKHESNSSEKDDPDRQGKESVREHLDREAREGRVVKENPDSIPTAGGEKLGSKHWGESQKLPE